MSKTKLLDAFAPGCPIRNIISRFSDKWALLVINELATKGKSRFNQIHVGIPDISKRMLSVTLKRLMEDALVERTEYNTVPPTVEYALTEMGESFVPLLINMIEWGLQHQDAIITHRTKEIDTSDKK